MVVSNPLDYELAECIFQEALKNSQTGMKRSGDAGRLDKMSLMQAYEAILRNEGILPVSDSKIYTLVFKVFDKCKSALNYDQLGGRNPLQNSLREHKEKTEWLHRALAYNEFRL